MDSFSIFLCMGEDKRYSCTRAPECDKDKPFACVFCPDHTTELHDKKENES